MLTRFLAFLANVVIWLPFGSPRRQQPVEIDKAISETWRQFLNGEIDEQEAGKRDAELRRQQPRPP